MAHDDFHLAREVVELSDDEDEFGYSDAQFQQALDGISDTYDETFDDINAQSNTYYSANDREIIDLTAIPDIDVPPSDAGIPVTDDEPAASIDSDWGGDTDLITDAACMQMVLNVFPDIAADHVLDLIKEKTTDATRTMAQCERIITELLDAETYPKESDEVSKNLKRKREPSDELSEYEKGQRDPKIPQYEQDAVDLLKDEFLDIPVRYITNVLKKQKTLFKSYEILEEQLQNHRKIHLSFSKIGKKRIKRGVEQILVERGSQLPKELHAAKKKNKDETAKRTEAEKAEQAEKDNLQQAEMNNEMGECQCCFGDFPLNRMICCNGDNVHFFCMDCPKQYIETEMGMSHCRPVCFATDKCKGTFRRHQFQQVLSEKTFERLEHMQQQQDLAAAGLSFLSECPFCDFKMECLPPEVDKEFRCQNQKCGKTSCRLCQKETHIPLSCEEVKKDGQITLRHIVEEAMSAALIRHCNKCKHPFVKDLGCNKMTCSHCRNVQCYVCSTNVKNYNHFGDVAAGLCPLHDNIEDRHEQEVKKAADAAMAKVQAENPQLSEADLMIQVSDRVKLAEDERKTRAAAQNNAFPYHMLDGQIAHRGAAAGHLLRVPPPVYVAPYQLPFAVVPALPFNNNPFLPAAPQPPFVLPQNQHNQYWLAPRQQQQQQQQQPQPYQPRVGAFFDPLAALAPAQNLHEDVHQRIQRAQGILRAQERQVQQQQQLIQAQRDLEVQRLEQQLQLHQAAGDGAPQQRRGPTPQQRRLRDMQGQLRVLELVNAARMRILDGVGRGR